MNIFVYGHSEEEITRAVLDLLEERGTAVVAAAAAADISLAPLLQRKLSPDELAAPRLGVLVFHPSLLPRHRGPDAIKRALASGAAYTGATWFWADARYDAGAVCEQEVLEIMPGERPRAFYERAAVPSALRMLSWILDDLRLGYVRRRPQREEAATYEGRFPRRQPADSTVTINA